MIINEFLLLYMVLYDIIMMRELLKVKQEMDTVMPLEFEKHPFFIYLISMKKIIPIHIYSKRENYTHLYYTVNGDPFTHLN